MNGGHFVDGHFVDGHFADGHFVDRTLRRPDISSSGNFFEQLFHCVLDEKMITRVNDDLTL